MFLPPRFPYRCRSYEKLLVVTPRLVAQDLPSARSPITFPSVESRSAAYQSLSALTSRSGRHPVLILHFGSRSALVLHESWSGSTRSVLTRGG
jgi:hypothetical protein